ncbi:signal peptide-containing protein [Theileria equi strain WA]|uniref:Signal peptide-containing protein n=1 Tax=Theileria equi strain WA TaxID=1537102 RepID=L0AXZ9_THEEQ|nr:signal peptide-containing protein [Theileria equi strain WA]AFZ79789.1 signal peptide-containing protein [Theileria equi strain WA]|eukprot:XP_004829455.1 signal peptide-containing protein [Theileria equi strain WA]
MRVFDLVYFAIICGICNAGIHNKIQDISNTGNRLSTLVAEAPEEKEAEERDSGEESEPKNQEDVAEKEKTNLKREESAGEGIPQLVLVSTLLVAPIVIMTI